MEITNKDEKREIEAPDVALAEIIALVLALALAETDAAEAPEDDLDIDELDNELEEDLATLETELEVDLRLVDEVLFDALILV